MGAVSRIASSVINGTAQSGQKDNVDHASASSQASTISNANNTPDIKSADVKAVSGNAETPAPKTESSGSSTNWAELAKNAKSLLDSLNSSGSSPAPITANPASQASPLANFR